jgi:hypothetical protein
MREFSHRWTQMGTDKCPHPLSLSHLWERDASMAKSPLLSQRLGEERVG